MSIEQRVRAMYEMLKSDAKRLKVKIPGFLFRKNLRNGDHPWQDIEKNLIDPKDIK